MRLNDLNVKKETNEIDEYFYLLYQNSIFTN